MLTNNAYEFPLSSSVKSYVTNGRNQYTQVGGTTHGWDANGNLTSDGLTTFGYDTENRLVSASGPQDATLKYDPLGRLYEASTSSGVVRFVYDGDRLIAEYSTGGAVQRRYVHGAGVDEPLVWYEGAAVSASTRRYLHADHQGSIVAVSTPSGAMQQVRSYDAYGVTSAANTLRFQYTGQAAIPELGLHYYKARFYHPALGRFMQTDPIGYEDDVNLYAYVGNDPLNRIDPTGTCGSRIEGVVAAGCKSYVFATPQKSAAAEQQRTPQNELDGPLESENNVSRSPFIGFDSGPGEAAARAGFTLINDPNLSEEAKRNIALTAGSLLVGGTAIALIPAAGGSLPAAVAATRTFLGPTGPVFGRQALGGSSMFGINSNAWLRVGWGWRGTALEGQHVFRLSGKLVEPFVRSGHIDLIALARGTSF